MGGFRFNFSGVLSRGSKNHFWRLTHRLSPQSTRTHTLHTWPLSPSPPASSIAAGTSKAAPAPPADANAPAVPQRAFTLSPPPPPLGKGDLEKVAKEKEKKAYIRSLKEAPSAVVNVKNEKDKISAEIHEDYSIMELIEEQIDELKSTFGHALDESDESELVLGHPAAFFWAVLSAVLFQEMKGDTILHMQYERGTLSSS